MRKVLATLLAAMLAATLTAAPAEADFGLHDLEVRFTDEGGSPSLQAGSHPYAMTTGFALNSTTEVIDGETKHFIDGAIRDLDVEQAAGLVADPNAVPACATLDFLTKDEQAPACSDSSAVGVLSGTLSGYGNLAPFGPVPVYLLAASRGTVATIGFYVDEVPLTVDIGLDEDFPHRGLAILRDIPQVLEVVDNELTLWGVPADPSHNDERGRCVFLGGSCPSTAIPPRAFLTLPRSCEGPLPTTFRADPWWTGDPLAPTPGGPRFEGTAQTGDLSSTPPTGTTGCESLELEPSIDARPTTNRAESATGLGFTVEIDDPGLTDPAGTAQSDIKAATVVLPEGVTVNPSQAEGLGVCSEEQFAGETASSPFGAGCPDASKIGDVQVETPLLEGEVLKGSLFVAEPYENRFGSLLAIFMTVKSPERGIGLRLAGEVEPDPRTGQLVTSFDQLPQLPFSDFRLAFRGGPRAPLVSPPRCGTYETRATFTPWATPAEKVVRTSSFTIDAGAGGDACPSGVPFEPGFDAGTADNRAGSFSPFLLRLTRRDGDQPLTRFDASLPPGLVAKLAGVSFCPEEALAAAKAKSGRAELTSPSCPASSRIGAVLAGAGVGEQLTYVRGSVYLAGPFGGAPLSVAAVVPAVAGPFDVGTVITREALAVDSRSAEVRIDGAASDPIPHILAGIPLRLRKVSVDVDRSDFTLNPTSCEPFAIGAQLWGGGAQLFDRADDWPVGRSVRFQAADCGRLGFRPRLSIRLKGGTKRGDHPALRAVFRPRPRDASTKSVSLRLPRSAFLEQAHIRTICTRVQFAADACPKGAIYGRVTAFTPLLDQPLKGPVYLRSSNNKLPDLVFDLRGVIDIEASARIDSRKRALRATFESIPDAPLTKVVVRMQGGKKGLIVNSRNLCTAPARAIAVLGAHNGRESRQRPLVRPSRCGKPGPRSN